MPGPWLYTLGEGRDRNFELNGESIPVTIESYRRLVDDGRIREDRWWRIKQLWNKVQPGDELFLYTGNDDKGIIGYGTVTSVSEREGEWHIEPNLDLPKCRMLLESPIPAALVRTWPLNLRRNVIDLSEVVPELESRLPWKKSTN
jgi:hypothetical protein